MSSITLSFKKDSYSYLQEQRLTVTSPYGETSTYEEISSSSSGVEASPIDFFASITSPFRSDELTAAAKDSGFLPPGVKLISDGFIVYERPPTFKTIFYSPTFADQVTDDSINAYSIAVPWQLYIAQFSDDYLCSDVYMYFMDTPLQSLDQRVYMPTIPNFYTNGLLCRPRFATMDEVTRYSLDVSGVIASSYDWVWNNGTNNDLTESLVHLLLQNMSGQIATLSSQKMPLHFKYNRISSMSYFSSDEVTSVLASWETLSLDDIMSYKWPNPSRGKTFSPHSETGRYQEMSAYSDNLHDYLYEVLSEENGEEPDEDYICDMIDSDDYNQNHYISWLIANGHVMQLSPEWEKPVTYMNVLEDLKKSQVVKKTSFMLDFNKCLQSFFPIVP